VEKDKFLSWLNQLTKLMPIDASMIPLLIIFTVIIKGKKGIYFKVLMAELPYSEMGVRYHFRRLIRKKLLKLKLDDDDKRRKIILPTKKLINLIDTIK
jgi:hypothetical protein